MSLCLGSLHLSPLHLSHSCQFSHTLWQPQLYSSLSSNRELYHQHPAAPQLLSKGEQNLGKEVVHGSLSGLYCFLNCCVHPASVSHLGPPALLPEDFPPYAPCLLIPGSACYMGSNEELSAFCIHLHGVLPSR